MKSFTIDDIKKLVEESLKEKPTGDDWLDSRYNEQVHWVGHTQPYYRLFYLIAKQLQPNLSVELGSWQATAAAHLAAGNPTGQVFTVDIHREDKDAQLRAIEADGHYKNLTYVNRWTKDAFPIIKAARLNSSSLVDILFIDAWHNYDEAMSEYKLYSELLADEALVICDDITAGYNFEGMLKFWDELPEPKFLDSRIHPGIPMGFVYVGANRAANQTQRQENTKPSPRKRTRKSRAA